MVQQWHGSVIILRRTESQARVLDMRGNMNPQTYVLSNNIIVMQVHVNQGCNETLYLPDNDLLICPRKKINNG